MPLRCEQCGKMFTPAKRVEKRTRFCSAVCRTRNHVQKHGVDVECSYCKKPIKVIALDLKRFKTHCCSRKCSEAYKKAHNIAGNLQEMLGYRRRHTERIRAMLRINKELKCVECGCDDLRILEINHINGGGGKDYRKYQNKPELIYMAILRGDRKTDDLNILCRVCNAAHYAAMRGIKGFVVTYKKA